MPRTNISIRFGPQLAARGSSSITPPRLCQPLQTPGCPWTTETSIHRYQTALSEPFAKQSSRLTPRDEAPSPAVMIPRRSSQPLQDAPFHHLWYMWLTMPRTKQSMRFGLQETAAGEPSMTPPRSSQPLQLAPFHHLCHMWLSEPLAKQSSRFGAQEATAGPEVIM